MSARKPDVVARADTGIGARIADSVTSFAGSWTFILLFAALLVLWMLVNTVQLAVPHFDRPPFIGLNLFLSFTAAFQAPFILMSQNRQAAKDHARDETEAREVDALLRLNQEQLALLRRLLGDSHDDPD